jgi:hypothetical protein
MPMKPLILQIPLKGGSGNVRSGAIQFKNDWPGMFIRGDHAIAVAASIRHMITQLPPHKRNGENRYFVEQLQRLATTIESEVDTRNSGAKEP